MKIRKLIALLATLLLVVTPLTAIVPVSVSAEMGGDFPWTDTDEKMLIEEILERDGFIDGIWLPWFNSGQTGHNLTGNDLMATYYNSSSAKDWNRVEMDYLGADVIYQDIYNLKAMGYNIMAYGGSIFGEGVIFDENGDVLGIKEEYLTNARRLLDICRAVGMPVMWNIYFHDSSMPSYYGMEGWHVICQMLGNNEIADHYAERFVRPLCEMLAEYPDVVALVSIADEPENQINDIGKGDHFDTKGREMYGVNQDDMIYFMQQINEVAREELPNVARTVASNNGNKTIYRDFDLDLMGHNQYTDGDTFKSVESLITDADPILTEYNIGNSVAYTDDAFANKLITFREWMMNNGYKGGFQWCWMPDKTVTSTSSKEYYLQKSTSHTTYSFRKTVSLLRYYIDEYRAEYRGETIVVDAPVLYANTNNKKVQWIPSKRATTITIQRSDDGGNTWVTVLENATQSSYVNSSTLIGAYTDSTAPSTGYCFRIIAKDANGNTVTSEPNDVAGTSATFKKTYKAPTYVAGKYYITSSLKQTDAKLTSFGVEKNRPLSDAVNLIQNGSFESTGGQWNTSSFLTYAQVVSDSTTPDGSKSLYFDTSAQNSEGWYTFTVTGLKANTEYTFSAFIKGAYLSDSNKGQGSIGVIDPDTGKYMFYWEYFRSYPRASRETKQMYPTAYDDEWHIRSVTFNTGDLTSATIALYGYSTQMWVDGLALFETVNGMKYENGESAKAITSTEYTPASGAANAIADPNVNDASYWSAGAGYKQGFMSVTGGKLKYTASSEPNGVRYTKWFAVKPGTDYYVTYTINVTTAGAGRVAIMDNSLLLPYENLTTTFSSVGQKTVTGRISTGMYDQLGFSVVDLGGVATIDNISVYEGGESVVIPTTPSFDGYIINGDFEIGSSNGWENLWNNNTVEIVAGRDSSFAMKGTAGGSYTQVRQKITVEKNTDYVIEVWAKDVNGTTLIVKDSADANLKQTALQGSGSTWTKTVLEFNSGEHEFIYLGLMGSSAGKTWTVDDVTMYEKKTESNDGYLVNGDFETGISNPWENLWGSNTITMVEGHDSSYGMKVNAGQYTVVRQKVAVEKNTDYVITLWSKSSVNGSLLIKDSADSQNIVNQALNTGSEWKQITVEFNSGNNTYVYVGFMGGAAGSSYIVDDVVMTCKAAPEPVFGVVNGGFEDGKDGWTFGSGTNALVTDAHSGNNAIQLTNPGLWASAAEQTIAVEPNTSYTITWWYKATSGTGIFNLFVMNANGYANLTSTGGKNYMNNYTGGWQQGTYVVNSGSAEAIIIKFSTEGSNPGTIIVDDVAIEKTAEHSHEYTSAVTKQPTCGETGVRTYTCSCGEGTYTETIPATGAHTYDNACDTSCNVCGATRTVSHQYSGACDQYCDLCGAKKAGLSIGVSHTYSYDCDAECDVCGFVRTGVEHYYVGRVTTAATCERDGVKTYTCYWGCGSSYTEAIPATGHSYADGICGTCGAEDPDYEPPHVCEFVGVQTKAPTCEDEGVMTYSCACGEGTYTESIPALGHKYDSVVTDPDCVNGGYTTYTCSVCGDSYVGNETAALGHSYTAEETKAPTCGAEGVLTYTCSTCGDSYTESVPATGEHVYDDEYDADCNVCGDLREVPEKPDEPVGEIVYGDANGDGEVNLRDVAVLQQYTAGWDVTLDLVAADANGDGEVNLRDVAVLQQYTAGWDVTLGPVEQPEQPEEPHVCEFVGVQTQAPTCENEGVMTYSCACGEGTYTESIPALGHIAGAAADCENAQVCTVCGEVLNAALGHSYKAVVTAPDCVNGGYTTHTCANCGDSYKTDTTAALGHNYVGVVTKAPTCGSEGVKTYTCSHCGDSYTEAIDAVGEHIYDDEYDAECNGCGDVRDLPVNDAELGWKPANKE